MNSLMIRSASNDVMPSCKLNTASTTAGACSRFVELLLGLRWREWLTRCFLHLYLSTRACFHLNDQAEVENPDQRISEDLRTLTTTRLSFLVMTTNSTITVAAFDGVLYPLLATSLIVFLERRLVALNNLQLKKEADFRLRISTSVPANKKASSPACYYSSP